MSGYALPRWMDPVWQREAAAAVLRMAERNAEMARKLIARDPSVANMKFNLRGMPDLRRMRAGGVED